MMEEDMGLEEQEEAIPEERLDDLPINVIREEIILSVTDIVDIPLFSGEFVLPEHTSPLTFNDVFTTNEISRQHPDIISQEVLFRETVIVAPTVSFPEEETVSTISLIFSFALLGLSTMMFMNLYLKRKQKVK